MTFTIITVNYNSARHILALLRSLEQQTDTNFDVMVVDNDSTPEDRAVLGEYAPISTLKLDIIYSDTNRGFSGGNNLAIRKALAQGSDWMVLLNPDTTVPADFIVSLKSFSSDQTGIIAIPVREGDKVAYAGIVRWFCRTLPHLYDNLKLKIKNLKLYAIGAGVAIHRSVFDKIGLLDERYFLYFEDAEFSMRARKAGININIAPLVITHTVSQSTRNLGRPLLLRYHARNALLFNWTRGPWWIKIALPFWSIFAILVQSFKILIRRKPAESQAILNGITDFYARRFGKITP